MYRTYPRAMTVCRLSYTSVVSKSPTLSPAIIAGRETMDFSFLTPTNLVKFRWDQPQQTRQTHVGWEHLFAIYIEAQSE